MKHYCIFSAYYLPHLGGVERYVSNISKELIARKNKVTIVTSAQRDNRKYKKDNRNYERDGLLTIIRLPSIEILKDRFPVVMHYKKWLNQIEDVDLILINTRFYPLSLVAAQYADKNQIPAIVIEHGTGHFTINNRILDKIGHVYEHRMTALIKRKIKKFYGVSKACNDWLRHFKIDSDGILYNAIDMNAIKRTKESLKIRNLLQQHAHQGEIILTYTGRLVKEKGILKLIQAYQEVKKTTENVTLFIAGDGELLKEIKEKKLPGVNCLGKRTWEEVITLLKYSDIYCLPTDYPEGFPTSILEAIACNVYVITTTAGGSKEILSDGTYGSILYENTVEHLASELEHVIKNPLLRKDAAEKAYEKLVYSFTWEKTVDRIEQL